MVAGSASLALHGGLVLLVVVATGEYIAQSPRQGIALTPIEVIQTAPSTPPRAANPVAPPIIPAAGAVPRARRQQVQRPQPSTPPTNRSLADLTIGYEDPTNFADKAARTADVAGDVKGSRIGKGIERQLGDNIATMEIPQPPVVSRARAPRPKFDYTKLRLHGASKFAGQTIKLLLVVDTSGRVREVRLLEGVDRDLDRRTIALVHNFEFEPALDDDGVAVRGTSRWDIQIVEDEDDAPFKTVLERSHL
jgi:hypothetical protein